MKFKLLAGMHHEPNAKNPSTDGMGNFIKRVDSKKDVIIETDNDLCELFGTTKFERVDGPSEAHRDRADQTVNDKKVMDKGAPNAMGLPTGGAPKKRGSKASAEGEDQINGQKATRGKAAKKAAEDEPSDDDEPVIANAEDAEVEDAPEGDGDEEPVDYGKDATASFTAAIGAKNKGKVAVTHKGADYFVFDAKDKSKPLNTDPLHKNKVGAFIKDYVKEGGK